MNGTVIELNELRLLRKTSKPRSSSEMKFSISKKEHAHDNSTPPNSGGYDSGIGESPYPASEVSTPPNSLPLNINIKPKPRRRRRGSSSTGDLFEDNYVRTGKILGSGAFAKVEVCKDVKTDMEYAVKIIKKENWYTRNRVFQEVEILHRGSNHPNIIQLKQFFEGTSHFYLVFEMMRGGALIDHIESHKKFTEREAAIVLRGVTKALKHLHDQGIAHRDLKFENILCGENFTDVKICDFDLGGTRLDVPTLSTPLMDSPVGSAEFMAPEVVSLFEGNHSFYDKSCDMWSLGVLLYIMIYGKPPFTGRCGLNCGWDEGEECRQCQESLFHSITYGRVNFDSNMNISDSVKHLISNLLVKNAQERLTATEVLDHEWLQNEGNNNILPTSQQLKRNASSALNLGSISTQINEHYRVINSAVQSPSSPQTNDPIGDAMRHLDIGESWYEEDDEDYIIHEDTLPFSPREDTHHSSLSISPDSAHGPSPPTPTSTDMDNTPIQTHFLFAGQDTKVNFYLSSDDEDDSIFRN